MRVEPIRPDVAAGTGPFDDGAAFGSALDALGGLLTGAHRAEDAFAGGFGTLQEAVYERARADVALSVAAATAQRTAQSVQTLLNMQI